MLWFRRSKTFKELAEMKLEEKRLKSKNTYASAKIQLSRLIVHFGHMRIREINETAWTEYVLREQAKKPRTFFDDKKYMSQVMLSALEKGYVKTKLKLSIPDIPSEKGREITQPELDKLFEHAGMNLTFQMKIALLMGMRLREILHLHWTRFDEHNQCIRLTPEDTKTRRGRIVPIHPDLFNQFQEWHDNAESPYVFAPRSDSSLPYQDSNKTAWRICTEAAGVKARFHDLRHTCATRMLRAKARREAVKGALGMTNKVLDRIYTHLSIEDLHTVHTPEKK